MPNIYVYVWFDIEDYVTRESDDLPLTAFSILKKYKIPVTCKLVAEKIRFLKENGRSDVLSAIAEQDVGYHLDTHSRHPTTYEYLRDLDVRRGAKEFFTRERSGFELVKRTFSRTPSCFGHPGPAWAPHVYSALMEMGISIYLDETSIINVYDQPYWYCGVLNLNGANRNFIVFDYTFNDPKGISILKQRFKRMHDSLKRSGGAVSILFHLHTAINREFWDAVNFREGKNRTKEKYQRPPTQPTKITRRAWKNFEELIRYVSSFPDVKFITATEAAKIYKPSTRTIVSRDGLSAVSKHCRKSCDFFELDGGFVLSPSQIFYAVANGLSQVANGQDIPDKVEFKEPLGPMVSSQTTGSMNVSSGDLVATAKSARAFMDAENCLPSTLRVGDYANLSPEDFLATASKLLGDALEGKRLTKRVVVLRGKSPNKKYVNAAAFRKACRWTVLPRNFKAPRILEQIELQAWTLRPATLST